MKGGRSPAQASDPLIDRGTLLGLPGLPENGGEEGTENRQGRDQLHQNENPDEGEEHDHERAH